MSVFPGRHPISFSVVILMQRIKLDPAQDRSGGPATRDPRSLSWSAVATLTDRGEGDVLIHSGGERSNGGFTGKIKVKSPQMNG